MKSTWRGFVPTLALAIVSALPLSAQSTARIEGEVVDPADAAIATAVVVCRNTATGLTFQTLSDTAGIFRFAELPIGSYEITVSKAGFQKMVRGDVELLTGHTLDLKLHMRIGAVSESVQVSSEVALVQNVSSEV